MKSNHVEESSANTALKGRKDLKKTILDILTTYSQLPAKEGRGFTFIAQILKGEPRMAFQKGEIIVFKRFATHRRKKLTTLLLTMHEAEKLGFLAPTDETYSQFRITEEGRQYLREPYSVIVYRKSLRYSYPEFTLRSKLRTYRRVAAEHKGMESYEAFSTFALDQIVQKKPESLSELQKIAGMNQMKAEMFGAGITGLVKECNSLIRSMFYNRVQEKAASPTYQATKALFKEGLSIKTIAEQRGIKESTVLVYLEALHMAGEIDLRPWIEENLNGKTLYKGAEYFKNVSDQRLKQAYETLGLEYETLRLCRLYVSDFHSGQTQLKLTGS